jgi:hypothetical protein
MRSSKSEARTVREERNGTYETMVEEIQERFLSDVKSGIPLEDARNAMNRHLDELEAGETIH